MGYTIENDCVGCPQGCIHCSRHDDYKVYYCDHCGKDFDLNEDTIYIDSEGYDICEECYLKQFTSKICDDMDEDHCACCCGDAETLYWYDEEWRCRECVLEDADRRTFD